LGMRAFMQIVVALLGAGLIVAGVALWSIPAALIIGGLFVLVTLYIDAYLKHVPTNGGQPR
jgi:hypothetical protein